MPLSTLMVYLQICYSRPDAGKPDMLLAQKVSIHTTLSISDDKEGSTDVTQFHLFVEIIVIEFESSQDLLFLILKRHFDEDHPLPLDLML